MPTLWEKLKFTQAQMDVINDQLKQAEQRGFERSLNECIFCQKGEENIPIMRNAAYPRLIAHEKCLTHWLSSSCHNCNKEREKGRKEGIESCAHDCSPTQKAKIWGLAIDAVEKELLKDFDASLIPHRKMWWGKAISASRASLARKVK